MSTPLRACVIGCTGGWYQKIHHPSLQRLADKVRLVAGTSRDPERREKIAGEMGFERAYADVDEMLDKEKPDFAFISITHTEAADMACRVLERNIPMMMEKPVGQNPAEGRRVLEAAKKAGVPNMVAFNRRHNPFLIRAKQLADERGGVSHLVGEWMRHDVKSPTAMMGSMLHMVDALRFLGGDVASFSGAGSATQYFDNALVASSFHLTFESGAACAISHNVRCGRAAENYRIHAENWSVTVGNPPPGRFDSRLYFQVEEGGRLVERITAENLTTEQCCAHYTQGFWQESEHFVDCLISGAEPSPSVAEAVKSMELAQAMQEAVVPPGTAS
jgi:virulence factor